MSKTESETTKPPFVKPEPVSPETMLKFLDYLEAVVLDPKELLVQRKYIFALRKLIHGSYRMVKVEGAVE